MAGQLISQVDRRLLVVAVLSALAGSALVALVSSLMVLQVTFRQAIANSKVFEGELIRDLTGSTSLTELQNNVQLGVNAAGIQEVLVLDGQGRVLAASNPPLVGRTISSLAADSALGALAARLRDCERPTGDNPCRLQESTQFVGSLPLLGGTELLRTRRTPLSLPAYVDPQDEVVLVTSLDLRPLLNRSLLLAPELFLAGVLPLLLTSGGVVLLVRRSVLPELFRLAQTDSLSGVYNRRAFFDAALQLLANAELFASDYVLCILDVDRFKDINDTHGHGVGDEVIRYLSDRLLSAVRRTDVVGRLGGDEFVLLIEASRSAAHQLLERTRLAVASAPFRLADGRHVPLQLSIGMASTEGKAGYRLRALLEEADAALYVAKRRGRNQIVDLEGGAQGSLEDAPPQRLPET